MFTSVDSAETCRLSGEGLIPVPPTRSEVLRRGEGDGRLLVLKERVVISGNWTPLGIKGDNPSTRVRELDREVEGRIPYSIEWEID